MNNKDLGNNINFKIDNEVESYLFIFETLLSSNSYKKSSEILDLLVKLVDKEYITKEIFNEFLQSGELLNYIKKYLPHSQIDITNIEDYLLN